MASSIEIVSSNEINGESKENGVIKHDQTVEYGNQGSGSKNGGGEGFGRVSEIAEEGGEEEIGSESFSFNIGISPLESIREDGTETSSLFSFDFRNFVDIVHVGITKKNEQLHMDALRWTLTHLVNPSYVVHLVYIFPEVKKIPTLLGKIRIDHANDEQKEAHLAYEKYKRDCYLNKFLNLCAQFKVKAETVLVESKLDSKVLVELIPALHIRKLVVGTRKRNIKSSNKIGGAAGYILREAPEYCEVKIICKGKEVRTNPAQYQDQDQASTGTTAPSLKHFHEELELGEASDDNNNN